MWPPSVAQRVLASSPRGCREMLGISDFRRRSAAEVQIAWGLLLSPARRSAGSFDMEPTPDEEWLLCQAEVY